MKSYTDLSEREGANAQRIELAPVALQGVERLVHGRAGGAEIDDAQPRRLLRGPQDRLRHQLLGGLEFAQQALHVLHVIGTGLAVARIAVLGGAAGEERAARRVRAGIGAEGDAVAVHVEIAPELLACVPAPRPSVTLPRS